jgi:hypothetical protein
MKSSAKGHEGQGNTNTLNMNFIANHIPTRSSEQHCWESKLIIVSLIIANNHFHVEFNLDNDCLHFVYLQCNIISIDKKP